MKMSSANIVKKLYQSTNSPSQFCTHLDNQLISWYVIPVLKPFSISCFAVSLQGHAVSGALFGGHGGGSEHPAYQQDAGAAVPYQGYDQPMNTQQQGQGPCHFEMQQFVECAQNQRDITLCQGFNEALRQCKLANGKKH